MDPEQIYQEVLQEEQQKGSSSPVAEGRAKAARQRAVEGSPHPKEPRWWPGSQPHFEGGEAAPAAEEPAAEEPAVEEAPAAEAPPAPPAPAPAPAAEPAPAPAQPAAQPAAPAVQPAAAAPAAVAAPPAPAPAPTQTVGVTHGTAGGNRLRPEDAVASEAQFDGERAMRERRKVIDELVSTGVPAVTARQTGGGSSPLLLLLYILIPLIAIIFLVNQEDELREQPAGDTQEATGEGGGGGGGQVVEVVASGTAFNTDSITLAAEGESTIHLVNEDSVQHNIAIYEDESASAEIFVGETISADEIDYTVPGPGSPMEAYFQCDIHPNMNGTAIFE